jgi:thymidylate synthase ThyX
MREYGDLMLVELRKVIPEFLKRVDQPDRGVAWTHYWRAVRERTQELADKLVGDVEPEDRPLVNLVDYDAEGELKVTAAALYAASDLPDDQLLAVVRGMTDAERAEILAASIGERGNRRHKPGRAWERTQYRFDVLCDYGAFRDLQRHRPLTLEWQRLTPRFGYDVPEAVVEAGLQTDWHTVMERSRETHDAITAAGLPDVAQYAVSMAYRIRFVIQMTAREAMHLTELRSQPAGHPVYRAVAQEMHRQIAQVHPSLAGAFTHISYEDVDLERLEAERRTELKRKAQQG